MLSYPAAIPLSNHTLTRLAELIRARHAERRCRWRRLDASRQALLVLAHLRNGDTYARLAAGFAIGTSTAWRYVREAADLLALLADDVHAAVLRAVRLAYAILDGTLIPIDALTAAGVKTFADRGYQGAGGSIRTPFKGHRLRPPLSRHQRSVNRAHARIRACGERAVATLKTWKILARLRCCPHRATTIVQAILVLQLIEEDRYSG
ncbi:transposase family protein [Nonomuraea rubra]|uniref:transposase family protein n=1 Tax=Nonomuraea rubra TaxID=46180 RepID=UPI0033CECD92